MRSVSPFRNAIQCFPGVRSWTKGQTNPSSMASVRKWETASYSSLAIIPLNALGEGYLTRIKRSTSSSDITAPTPLRFSTGPPPKVDQQSDSPESKLLWRLSEDRRRDIVGNNLAFSAGVLRCRWVEAAFVIGIGYLSTVANRPGVLHADYLEGAVYDNRTRPVFVAREGS